MLEEKNCKDSEDSNNKQNISFADTIHNNLKEESVFSGNTEEDDDETIKAKASLWKEKCKVAFNEWIDSLMDNGDDIHSEDEQSPDIYSFYEQLCILRMDHKKMAKRQQESLVELGSLLENFVKNVESVTETQKSFGTVALYEKRFLALVHQCIDIQSRFNRVYLKIKQPPITPPVCLRSTWIKSWKNLEQGFSLINSHLRDLLDKNDVTQIKTTGELFNPLTMIGVAVVAVDSIPENTVVEEISPGYLYKDQVIKLAEVTISGKKGE